MKTILLALFTIVVVAGSAWADGVQFIVVTRATVWKDWQSDVGEVETVLSVKPDGYEIWTETGKTYVVPKANAQIITAEDAALRLVQHRQALYAEIRELSGTLQSDAPKSSTERYYQRKAARDAQAKAAVDNYYQWKLREFLDRH